MMRNLLLASLALVLSSSTGCMVLDEVDKAGAMMDANAKNKPAAPAATGASAAKVPQENPVLRQSKEWWNNATSLSTEAVDASIVSCRLQSGTQFMSKDDCLSRGGSPKGV